MTLRHMKIGTRIYLGFGSLILLGMAVAGVGAWGIDAQGRQAERMNVLAGNLRLVASAMYNQEILGRLILRASIAPDESLPPLFHEVAAKARDALTQVKARALSATRMASYQEALDKLSLCEQSADKTFDLGRKMVAGRTQLFSGGDTLTQATTRLIEPAAKTASPDVIAAAAKVEKAVLLVRVANWRFLATRDSAGQAVFAANVTRAIEALDQLDRLDVADLASLSRSIREALVAYRTAFEATAPALVEMENLFETVQKPLVATMQGELGKTDASIGHGIAEAIEISVSVRDTVTNAQIMVAGLALVGGLMLAFFVGRGISRPISGMTTVMGQLADGNHDVAIPSADSRDEIGDMARAVNVFKTSMIETERLNTEQAAARAARTRRQEAMDSHTRTFGKSVTGVMAALGKGADNMRRASEIMAESAAAVHHQASETAEGAGKSSADLTSVAAAVEQFTASVGEIARQVAVASDVASQAVQRAEASHGTTRGLAASTARIGDVVRLIDSIAGQTNLLALNATIEAARAGDAGKGFAVVAGEVKALAAQTAKATAEISTQIETVRAATEETVQAMNEIGGIIGKMGEVSTVISAAVEEQSVTTREIASSIQTVAGSTAHAAHAMENVVQVAHQAGDASRNIQTEAACIGTEAETLRREVEQFLQAVQTDAGDRRRFERINGGKTMATVRVPGSASITAVIQDVSKSGVALRHSGRVGIGREVEVELPEAGGPITGCVSREENGVLAVAFSDEPRMAARIEKALAGLSATHAAA